MRVPIVMLALGVALSLGASTPSLAKEVSHSTAENICGGAWTNWTDHEAGCDLTCGTNGQHICDYYCNNARKKTCTLTIFLAGQPGLPSRFPGLVLPPRLPLNLATGSMSSSGSGKSASSSVP